MLILISAGIVAVAVVGVGLRVAHELTAAHRELARTRSLQLISVFAPGIAAAADDPRALLTWQPLASTARHLFPAEFAAIDGAGGGRFPFTTEEIEAAHARWSTDWLAWERSHDAAYKLKAAEIERELASGGTTATRARLEAVEREKIDLYQQRYSEYVRVSKALYGLTK
ncbi:MAG: hypothetical protein A3H97_24125 [Acidobacteria bacterium RIFCSPLOWO2_02_FULL_65_29]|nr:MAG: hypothetical protein A3H97_24125 [Acidobacteria bacterium RIFCSPLOWO2_02_FULL_65_29]